MTIDTTRITMHWKTSVQGLAGAAIAVILAVMVLPTDASRAVIALAVLRAIVGFMQKDAGVADAILPGDDTPSAVASHEIPNDPKAVVVSEKQ